MLEISPLDVESKLQSAISAEILMLKDSEEKTHRDFEKVPKT